MSDKDSSTESAAAAGEPATRVKWDTSQLKSSYANVCNVTSTREEVVLNFGLNQDWERGTGELQVALTNRIIMSPFAARRLSAMLNQLLEQYEGRYGKLSSDAK